MKATRLAIPDVVLIAPKVFGDARGFFFESFNQKAFNEATGTNHVFVQDNHSRSTKGVLRGLHYQIQQPQGKLVRVARGAWPGMGRGGRHPQEFADLWPVGRRGAFRGQPAPTVGAARLCARVRGLE